MPQNINWTQQQQQQRQNDIMKWEGKRKMATKCIYDKWKIDIAIYCNAWNFRPENVIISQ